MLTSVLSLVVVLGTLAGLLWFLRRVAPRATGRHLRVVESVALGSGVWLHLVRVADRTLVVAASRERCELVSELEALPDLEPQTAGAGWRRALGARRGGQ